MHNWFTKGKYDETASSLIIQISLRTMTEPSVYISYTIDVDECGIVNDPTEVEEIYGMKNINYECDAPIDNTFSRFDF